MKLYKNEKNGFKGNSKIEDQFYSDLHDKIANLLSREKKEYNGTCYLADYSDRNIDELFHLLHFHVDKSKKIVK
jgi:hypothetical protein